VSDDYLAGEEELILHTLQTIDRLQLTVDELGALTIDLGLNDPLGGDLGLPSAAVDIDASRRSLLSKSLLEVEEGVLSLAPWFNLMVDAVSRPLLEVRMRRVHRDVQYEWTLFLDSRLGVQQQTGGDGVVVWAPFGAEHLVDIMFDAVGVRELSADITAQFETTIGQLNEWEDPHSDGADGPTGADRYRQGLRSVDRYTSMLVVIDQSDPAEMKSADLAWLDLASDGRWIVEVTGAGPPDADMPAVVTSVATEEVVRRVLALLPLDPEEVMRLASAHA
jgi:hypothetical protein